MQSCNYCRFYEFEHLTHIMLLLLACVPVALRSGSGQQSHLMELARKQRMNTDVRKSVFCVIMSSEVTAHNHALMIY